MDLVAGGGRWRLAMAGVVVALASAGCGGKTQREGSMPEPSNAGSASDATGGASGGSGHGAGATQMDAAAGASSNDCPVQQPVQGDACDDGQYCRYPIDECN